ncbi:IS66 family transposase [Nibrella viscosa]|uniref:IS66 family transposase n=1 Tax=Nibrella viscosa TaxID=1084524 RepID=UPI0031F07720
MAIPLHQLSPAEQQQLLVQQQTLIAQQQRQLVQLQQQVEGLQAQVEQYRRMLFGQKRERFQHPSVSLPLEPPPESDAQQQQLAQKQQHLRQNSARRPHPGRLPLPAHLPVEEIEIFPAGDLRGLICIGKDITDELECVPARCFIRRYIRYKYMAASKEGPVQIGVLPERVIAKGIPGAGLLAGLLVDKYLDHLPLYRQRQRFQRWGIELAASTLEGWTRQALERVYLLYEQLQADTKAKGYLQVDETPIRVLESERKGACHQGYYWVYHCPLDQTTLFDYQPTRSAQGPRELLGGFVGYLQSDGYGVYSQYGRQAGVTHLACLAHARREFERALSSDAPRAEVALRYIQQLYAVEAQARQQGLSATQRKELRLAQSLPVLNEWGQWLAQQAQSSLPRSQLGKAISYSMARWDGLCAYLQDGHLELDNNLVENAIRPIALGRKNYLFAGSHAAAQRAAGIYSLFAICQAHGVNAYEWLKYVLEHILTINHKDLRQLYPQHYKTRFS